MQRKLSSFDIYTLVTELQILNGSFIDQIYQRSPDELFLRLNTKHHKEKPMLYIKNEELITITTQKYIMPQKPTTFAMTLRKYLQNGIITSITQHEFDRILNFSIKKYDTNYTIIVELFSNGNILFVDASNTIILPLKIQQWAHRTIRPKTPYQPPPPQTNPLTLTDAQFKHILTESKKDIVRTLAINLNMGGHYAEELCLRSQIDKNTHPSSLSSETIQHLFKELTQFLDIFRKQQFNPQLITDHDTIIDVLPTPFKIYDTNNTNSESLERLHQGLAKLIPESPHNQQEQTTTISPKQQRLKRQLKQQQETKQEFQENEV